MKVIQRALHCDGHDDEHSEERSDALAALYLPALLAVKGRAARRHTALMK